MAQAPESAWRLLRVVGMTPRGAALDALAGREAARLGASGMLTGYGLKALPNGLEWFADGYRFDPVIPGRAGRLPFARAWRMDWQAPARIEASGEVSVSVRFEPLSAEAGATDRVAVEAALRPLCAPDARVTAVFDAIERGDADAAAGLDEMVRNCPVGRAQVRLASLWTDAAQVRQAGTGPLPPLAIGAGPTRPAILPEGSVARLLLSVRARASERGDSPGDALLEGALMHYLYAPAVNE